LHDRRDQGGTGKCLSGVFHAAGRAQNFLGSDALAVAGELVAAVRTADALENSVADKGLQHRFEVPGRQLVARGKRLGRHRTALRVHGDIDNGSNGKHALAGNQRHCWRPEPQISRGNRLQSHSRPARTAGNARTIPVYVPVEPKPPEPRLVPSRLPTSRNFACDTGATMSWAMRMPRMMLTGSSPRFTSRTCNSPR